jgi:hypothetical protein
MLAATIQQVNTLRGVALMGVVTFRIPRTVRTVKTNRPQARF